MGRGGDHLQHLTNASIPKAFYFHMLLENVRKNDLSKTNFEIIYIPNYQTFAISAVWLITIIHVLGK